MHIKNSLLVSVAVVGLSACSPNSSMTNKNTHTQTNVSQAQVSTDARSAAEDFVGHINYARIALAHNDADRAAKHVREARRIAELMENTTTEQRIDNLEAGRVTYNRDSEHKYHYFPIQTGPVQVKKYGHGPMWAKDDLAVTDADIVYLTVDLSGNKPMKRLDQAQQDITDGHLGSADIQLAMLTEETVTVDNKVALPLVKARDNIHLASNFLASGNYAGARYALKHADKALDTMENSDEYGSHHNEIVSMRKQVNSLQHSISKKNPSVARKASAKLNTWWQELKDWSNDM